MIQTELFVEELQQLGVSSFVGVPCSYLGPLINEIALQTNYLVASSEGESLGIATGSYLGGAELPCVLMQSSGLGNAINPLTSLVLPYKIPMLLVIGFRNSDGVGPPQHTIMGASTQSLLSLLGIEFRVLAEDHAAGLTQIRELAHHAIEQGTPTALLVPSKRFSPVTAKQSTTPKRNDGEFSNSQAIAQPALATRYEVLQSLIQAVSNDDLIVSTTGFTSRELSSVEDRPGNFYMVGSMGCAPSIGLGISLARPKRRVVVVDGDGALLMKLGTLATIGHYSPANLKHLVLDNGTYESTGNQPTVAGTVDFPRIAEAAGYAKAVHSSSPSEALELILGASPSTGPIFTALRIKSSSPENLKRVGRPLPNISLDFRQCAMR